VLAFQPHRYTRTRDCFEDFVAVMGGFDAVLLTEVYPPAKRPSPPPTAARWPARCAWPARWTRSTWTTWPRCPRHRTRLVRAAMC
jgi:UDP-N-acetylmuramate-alanine ligase